MRVTFQYSKTGREKVMNEREADILSKLGHGQVLTNTARPTYLTRDMQAAAPTPAAADPVATFETLPDEDDTEDAPKRRGRPRKVVEE